jgi:hypothetical protein
MIGERQVTDGNGRNPSGQEGWISSGYGRFKDNGHQEHDRNRQDSLVHSNLLLLLNAMPMNFRLRLRASVPRPG